jgi:hypothetical protein
MCCFSVASILSVKCRLVDFLQGHPKVVWRNMHCSEKFEDMRIKKNVKSVLNFEIQEAYTIKHEI